MYMYIPGVVVEVLREDVGEVVGIIHSFLRVLAVSGRGHVTSTPPTPLVVLVSGGELQGHMRIWLN